MTWKQYRGQIDTAITARKEWEIRQGVFYQMRHDGLPAANKPWKNASDLHFPLIDSFIDKLKPFYVQQLYGAETVAKFVSCKPETDGKAESAERYFDYVLKQDTNFESEIQVGVDWMLQGGFSTIKTYWDASRQRLCFDAIEPEYVIVPQHTRGLQDADWFVQVHRYSVDAFKRNPLFSDVLSSDIKKITGKGAQDNAEYREQYKARREGLTYGTKEEIIVWEFWRRDEVKKEEWVVEYRSPLDDSIELRPAQRNPYRHKQLPFVEFQYEVKDKGYYASRGIAERLAPLETSITRLWNEYHNAMTLLNRPLFKAPVGTTAQAVTLSWQPGDIITANIERLDLGDVPVNFEREMNNIREIAEYLINMPDFGTLDETGGQPTATKTRAVVASTGNTNNLRSRVFRKSLSRIYNQAWALVSEFMRPGQYLVDGQAEQMDPDGMSDDYVIHPSGSADAWNQAQETQDAINLFQLLNNDSLTDQMVLRQNMGNKMDPTLCRVLFKDPGVQMAKQAARQMTELTDMIVLHAPMPIDPSDDDAAHLVAVNQWGQGLQAHGTPPDPETAVVVTKHIMDHVQSGQQKKNPKMPQAMQAIAPFLQALNQIIAAAQGAQQNTLPQQPGAGTHDVSPLTVSPAGPGAPATSSTQDQQNESKVVLALAAADKAGMQPTADQWNVAFTKMGLPAFPPGTQPIKPPVAAPKPEVAPV